MTRFPLPAAMTALSIAAAAPAALADDVTEALEAARAAYQDGDIAEAMEELSFAQGLLQARRTESFSQFLPDPPEGWTREIDTDLSGALMTAGGGVGAEGSYSDGTVTFTIRMIADSPIVGTFGGLLGNQMVAMASGGEIVRLDGVKVLKRDGSLSAVVDGRILVQAEGADPGVMMPFMEKVDFEGLENFTL